MTPSKPKLLLAACCGPCATVAFLRLQEEYEIIPYFWADNLDTAEEYKARLTALQKTNALLNSNAPIIAEPYTPENFLAAIHSASNLNPETEPEGGARCTLCYTLRLRAAAQHAKTNNCTAFATTLTTGPRKNAVQVNEIGARISQEFTIPFLPLNLKKFNGFQESVTLSQKLNLYRQSYCGCKFSKPKR